MIVKRQKNYSGYSEFNMGGSTYMPTQVMTDYALDPIENSVSYLESTPVGKFEPVGKKLRLTRGIVSPPQKIIREEGTKKSKNKNKLCILDVKYFLIFR